MCSCPLDFGVLNRSIKCHVNLIQSYCTAGNTTNGSAGRGSLAATPLSFQSVARSLARSRGRTHFLHRWCNCVHSVARADLNWYRVAMRLDFLVRYCLLLPFVVWEGAKEGGGGGNQAWRCFVSVLQTEGGESRNRKSAGNEHFCILSFGDLEWFGEISGYPGRSVFGNREV